MTKSLWYVSNKWKRNIRFVAKVNAVFRFFLFGFSVPCLLYWTHWILRCYMNIFPKRSKLFEVCRCVHVFHFIGKYLYNAGFRYDSKIKERFFFPLRFRYCWDRISLYFSSMRKKNQKWNLQRKKVFSKTENFCLSIGTNSLKKLFRHHKNLLAPQNQLNGTNSCTLPVYLWFLVWIFISSWLYNNAILQYIQ